MYLQIIDIYTDMNLPFRFITKTIEGARQKKCEGRSYYCSPKPQLEGGVNIFRRFFTGQTHVSFCMLCFVGVKLIV